MVLDEEDPATEPGSMDSPRPTRSSSESRPDSQNQRGELRVLRLIEVGHLDVLTAMWPSRVTIAMSTDSNDVTLREIAQLDDPPIQLRPAELQRKELDRAVCHRFVALDPCGVRACGSG